LIGQQSLLFHLPQTGRDDEEWERVARRFVELGETLVRDHPAVPDARRWLANGMSAAAGIYSHSPEKPFHNPALALKLARRAMELTPESGQQNVGWAQYRLGDWKGCISSLEKWKDFAKEGDYFGAMALWQLGDKTKAVDLFHRTDEWLAGYEKRWTPSTLPTPAMLWGIRAEAAALLGVNPPTGEAKVTPAAESKGPPG
jgi:hypothetical protein